MIVFNGEPFTRYTLRALLPFAHEIIVVEGAAPSAAHLATTDGHSRDGTLAQVRRFMAEEDPEGKVRLVTAEDEGHPGGWWPGEKDEQSRAYASRATGDYLWQVDVDEYYRPDDMARIVDTLGADPSIDAVTFEQMTFWGGLDYVTDGWYLRRGAGHYHRLFKWGPGYTYAAHRPPTVLDDRGRNLRDLHWVRPHQLGIRLHHYSLLLPKQVADKCEYYATAPWANRAGAKQWAQEVFLQLRRPFRVHNVFAYPSWLERYDGPHPPEVTRMVADLRAIDPGQLRSTDDIERLLASPWYRAGRTALKILAPCDRRLHRIGRYLSQPFSRQA